MDIQKPYLLFLGDAIDELAAKTAIGVLDWRPQECLAQFRLPDCGTKLDIPEMSIKEAAQSGAKTLLIGVATRGGIISESWQTSLLEALDCGMDIASGLHTRVSDNEAVRARASELGLEIHDVRHPDGPFNVANAEPRSGHRLLTVGTDCSVGKMYTALALEKELRLRDVSVDFRATGQTGIFIAGDGISVDAVIADFISGAIEQLCPANDDEHWDVIEGQGSLFHPSFAGVSLGLIHGAQPDSLVLCHEPTRTHLRGLPHQSLPSVSDCMRANLDAAQVVSPNAKFIGVSINTKSLAPGIADSILRATEDDLQLPCVDPMRTGVTAIIDQIVDV